jgi:rhomboid protease GluP
MNIHSLNDLGESNNNNNNGNNNNISNNNENNENNQNNQLFLAGMNPDNPNESFFEFLFPKNICKLKTMSFLLICVLIIIYIIQLIVYYSLFKPNGYRWSCLLYRFGALELSSISNYYQFFRLITSMITHNNFLHLFSNCLSIAFIGFYAEYELQNSTNYLLLFFISGIIGNFFSLLFSFKNISVGSSGAILGLCAYYLLYFILNWNNISKSMKCCTIIFFSIIFFNLFSGVTEGSKIVDIYSHIGGFLGGLAFSMFLTYRSQVLYRFNQSFMKLLYYLSIIFLVALPIASLIVIILREVSDTCQFICKKFL